MNNLCNNFVETTVVFKSFLLNIKKQCDENERITDLVERINYIKSLEKDFFPWMMQYFVKLNQITIQLNEDNYKLCKEFIRKELCPVMIHSGTVLNKHIDTKPFGYSGDYLVANYFYEDGYSGTTLWGVLMDRYTIQSPFAIAHRNRRAYLRFYIENLSQKNVGSQLNVSSFACGPSPEVFDLLDSKIANVNFFLLDGERGVIDFLHQRMKKYEDYKKKVRIQQENLINLIRKRLPLEIVKQDLIYCAGFFDYVHDSTSRKIIRYMMEHLKSDGHLIIVNVSKDDIKDVCFKMLANWDVNHRSEQDLLNLVKGMKDVHYKEVWADYITKRNLYLYVNKK